MSRGKAWSDALLTHPASSNLNLISLLILRSFPALSRILHALSPANAQRARDAHGRCRRIWRLCAGGAVSSRCDALSSFAAGVARGAEAQTCGSGRYPCVQAVDDGRAHPPDRGAHQCALRPMPRCCSAISSSVIGSAGGDGTFLMTTGRQRSPSSGRRSACTPCSAITTGGKTRRCRNAAPAP